VLRIPPESRAYAIVPGEGPTGAVSRPRDSAPQIGG
jgi:hypothetical protein